MLILKQNAANSVPTPPAGKGTIFLNPSDDLSVKTADGNITVFPTAGGANTQVYFNDEGSFGAVANLTFNKTTSVFTVTGNVAATNVLTDNLLYANGTAWDLSDPGGSNTQIQFNDEESFGGSAAFTFNKTSNLVSMGGALAVTGNVTAGNVYANSGTIGAQTLKGEGGNISNIQGANVSGAVASATSAGSATTAGTVTTAAQPNITSVGTLSSVAVTGNVTAGNVYANSGTIGAQTLKGEGGNISNIQGANVSGAVSFATTANAVAGANVSGEVSFAATANAVAGANVSGAVSFATTANAVAGANVSGEVSFAATANAVAGANVSGTVSSATTAGTVTTAAQPNITSVGTLTSVAVTGNATAGNVYANSGTIGASLLTGTLTTAAQPNITSVGTLTSAAVTGNVTAGNVYANSGTIGAQTLKGEGGNISNIQGANVSGAVASATAATTAGTVTTAAQPNITSVGTLSSLSVTGNVSGGNLTTAGVLTVSGTGTSSIAGNLDMTSNNIINLATPNDPNDAATKQYVDDVAQGLHTHDSCGAATPDTLANITGGTITYNNGTAGVGANLVTTGSFNLIDGVNVQTAGTRILVKNEANSAHNGIYVWSNATVITRATDFDTPTEMAGGDFTFVTAGTLYDNTGWVMTDAVTTVGTSPVPWVQFSGAGTYTAGTGLTLNGSQFNISNTTVTAASYGGGDAVATFTVNAQGQLTAAANTAITANAANLTGTTLASGIVTSSLTSVGTLGTLNVSGNANVGNLGTAKVVATGNVEASFFIGNGSQLTGIDATAIQNGTANVRTFNNANVAVSAAGNANVAVFTGTGANIAGTLNATGNVTAPNFIGNLANGTSDITIPAANGNINFDVAGNANVLVVTGTGMQLGAGSGGNISGANNVSANTFTGTLTTAAQPNITSVGTLTSLAVTGNVTAGNVYANSGTIGASLLAGTLTTAAQPNITSVGTLSSATVTGNVAAGNVYANSGTIGASLLTGTLTTAAQPNITSVGTLTSLSVTGNVTAGNLIGIFANGNSSVSIPAANGNINLNAGGNATPELIVTTTGANVAGTLGVTGNITGANVISTAYSIVSVNAAVSAAGTAQGNATALASEFNVVSTVASGAGVVLPTAVAGMRISVINTSANALLVYPASTAAINSAAANAAYSQPAGARLDYISTSTTQWYTLNATYG